MDAPIEFIFKPILLGAPHVWTVQDNHVMRRGGKRALDLTKVTSVTWGDMAVRGTRTSWIHLKGDGEPVKISCNESGMGDDRSEFLKLVGAICDAMEGQDRAIPVRIDGGVGFSMAMFVIGAIGALASIGFAVAGLLDWVERGRVLAILSGIGGAAALGFLAWSYAPWRQGSDVTLKELQSLVSLLISARA